MRYRIFGSHPRGISPFLTYFYLPMKKNSVLSLTLSLLLIAGQANIFAQATNGVADKAEDPLDVFNRVGASVVRICNDGEGSPYRIVVLGNSLSHHAEAPDIGWHHNHGMAASAPSKDYVHLLFGMVEDALPERRVEMLVYNIASFERGFDSYDFGTLDALRGFRPDLLVLQIGENVSFDGVRTPELFAAKYLELINSFRTDGSPEIVCATTFFPSDTILAAITSAAAETGAKVADTSRLTTVDPENFARNEAGYPGDRSVWKVEGIGMHPGDVGMRNIAEIIFNCIEGFKSTELPQCCPSKQL